MKFVLILSSPAILVALYLVGVELFAFLIFG